MPILKPETPDFTRIHRLEVLFPSLRFFAELGPSLEPMSYGCKKQLLKMFHGRSWSSSSNAWVAIHPPAPSLTKVRTLTLGVLIVAGGTLAALPFRRHTSTPDTSVPKTNATGPIGPVLGREEMLIEDIPETELPSLAITPKDRWPKKIEAARQIEMPLTYEDLAVPVEMQIRNAKQFSATETAQLARQKQESTLGPDPPRMRAAPVIEEHQAKLTTASSQPESILVSTQAGVHEPTTNAQDSPLTAPRLPLQKAEKNQSRKWIKQP